MRRCNQIKCYYYTQGNCKSCDNCKAKPYNINTKCARCLCCEGKEGDLRWGEKDKDKISQLNPEKIKRMLIIER